MARFAGVLCGLAAVCLHAPAVQLHVTEGASEAVGQRLSALRVNSKAFNCTAWPFACQPPFNCHLAAESKKRTIATEDGHADFSSWCASPYLEPAMHCQKGDLKKYGSSMRKAQDSMSRVIASLDSHYCFAWGHCDNFDITPNTTLDEAEHMCDEKFGHDAWTKMTKLDISIFDGKTSWAGVHLSKKAEYSFAMMACAMGNYHCDAIYCHQEYCSKKEFRVKWGQERPAKQRRLHGAHYPPGYEVH